MLARVSHDVLRTMAADLGVVGRTAIFNGQRFPAAALADACKATMAAASAHEASTGASAELVYEVLRLQRGVPLFAEEHLQRLASSLRLSETVGKLFHTPVPVTDIAPSSSSTADADEQLNGHAAAAAQYCAGADGIERVLSDIRTALRDLSNDHPDLEQNVKIVVFLTPRMHDSVTSSAEVVKDKSAQPAWCLSFCLYLVKAFYPPQEWYDNGIVLGILPDAQRHTPNAKIVQASLRQRAVDMQKETGCFEVLLRHSDGLIPEGSRSNYLLIDGDGRVHMSCDEDVLLGITRMAIEQCCAEAGIPVVKRKLFESDVLAAAAVAMTGTSVGVLPVREVAGTTFESAANPVIRRLIELYDARARRNTLMA